MRHYLILLSIVLLIAACTPTDTTDEQTLTEDSTEEQATDEGQTDAMDDTSQATQDDDGMSVSDKLKDMFTMKNNLEFEVEYEFNSNSAGERQSGTMHQYFKGADKIRMDTEFEDVESQMYFVDGDWTMCTRQDEWICMTQEMQTSATDEIQEQVETNPDAYDIEDLPGRTIAGARAECYRIVPEGGEVEYCFSSQGVPLYIKSTAQSEGQTFMTEMTATSYSTSVSDSAFEPPADAMDMDDYMQDMMQQYQ